MKRRMLLVLLLAIVCIFSVNQTLAAPKCTAGLTNCKGVCVDLKSNSTNCGACGTTCTGGMVCSGGKCVCPTGKTNCGSTCVDASSDVNNCGICGRYCGASPYPYETYCDAGTCKSRCTETQCGTYCVDTSSDILNCGECGKECPLGANSQRKCSGSNCTLICNDGWGDCNGNPYDGCESNLNTSQSCGACRIQCAAGPIGYAPSCVSGVCDCHDPLIKACSVGKNDNSLYCIDTQTDEMNCGACGKECPAGTTCQSGSCIACDPPLTICSLNYCYPNTNGYCDSSCVNIQTDGMNCGGCGKECPPDKNDVRCCVNGACADLQTDLNNCGTCGHGCPPGTLFCYEGNCMMPSAKTERVCPDDRPTVCSGVCVNTTSDPSNCGKCGLQCDRATCVNGYCILDMKPPFARSERRSRN